MSYLHGGILGKKENDLNKKISFNSMEMMEHTHIRREHVYLARVVAVFVLVLLSMVTWQRLDRAKVLFL